MKKITLGTPEALVPSAFCRNFSYIETDVAYSFSNFTCKKTPRGFLVEFPIEDDAQIYGFGLQLKQFNHRGEKLKLEVNADPEARKIFAEYQKSAFVDLGIDGFKKDDLIRRSRNLEHRQ